MKEVKLIVDGKEYKLTDEQMELFKLLGASCDTKEEKYKLFHRVPESIFFSIHSSGAVFKSKDSLDSYVNELSSVANYCKDKEIMTKRAKQEVLSRLLWRFSFEHGWSDDLWENNHVDKYYVKYDYADQRYDIYWSKFSKSISEVYFISEEIAKKAIYEIIVPFQNGELEVCKLWDK